MADASCDTCGATWLEERSEHCATCHETFALGDLGLHLHVEHAPIALERVSVPGHWRPAEQIGADDAPLFDAAENAYGTTVWSRRAVVG